MQIPAAWLVAAVTLPFRLGRQLTLGERERQLAS